MPNINDLFPSKFLKSADIKGYEPTVVIADVRVEEVGKDEHKPAMYFQGKEKGMVLNRTNADVISEMYGPNTDDWMGREITLFVTRVQGPNGMTDGLRVKAPTRRAAAGNHIVQDRGGFKTSEMRKPDPIEEVTGAPTRNHTDEEVPF